MIRRLVSFLLASLLLFTATACGAPPTPHAASDSHAAASSAPAAASSPAPAAGSGAASSSVQPEVSQKPAEPAFDAASVNWVVWDGVVEHLFFHPVVAYPQLAFDGDYKSDGIDDWMVTAGEYLKILQSVYDRGYVLVDIDQVWHESTDETGKAVMVRSELKIPEGKMPLILSYDDVNYYEYMLANGFTYKLVIGDNGQIWSYGKDPQGNDVYSQDLDAVTILDKFVREHPDFSPYGAKGCLSLTGYEGILGYRTQTEKEDSSAAHEAHRQQEIEAVKPIIAELKATGWTFGSHTWGHISLNTRSRAVVQADMEKWMAEVGALVGPTDVLFYPFGGRPDGDDVKQSGESFRYLQSQGFRIFCSVGIDSYSKIKSDICAVICDRLHPDGTTLRHSRDRYMRFYDAKDIMDVAARPVRDIDWQ